MNAKELHDLYAPLWEKVPETKPAGLVLRGSFWATDRKNGQQFRGFFDVDSISAAALCRVAVEDWLISQINAKQRLAGTGPDALVLKPNTALLMTDGGWDKISLNNTTHGGTGPTIHHALVATAMDVADA